MAKVVEIPGVGDVEFPDSMSDADIGAAIKKQLGGGSGEAPPPQQPATAAKPQTWAQKLGATDPRVTGMLDLVEGMASGAASTVYHGGDVVRQLVGKERIIEQPAVQQAMRAPSSMAGQAGKFGEQVAETVIPGSALTKGLKGAGMLTRIGAEAALGGTQAAMQSGGDPLATTLGIIGGGAGGWIGGRAAAAAGATPALGAAAKKALDFVAAQGAVVPAGVRSGSPFVRALEKVSGYSPFGAMVVQGADRQTSAALSKGAQQLLEQAHASPVTALQAGTGVREVLTESAGESKKLADEAYDLFRQAEADPSNLREVQVGTKVAENGQRVPVYAEVALPVDIRDIKKMVKPIYERMTRTWEPARRNASAGFQAAKSILESPDHMPASAIEDGLSGLKQLAREGEGQAAGLAKFIIPKVQEAVDDVAAGAGPEVLDAIKAGRAASAKEFTTKGVLKKLIEEPVQAFGQLTWGRDANINLLRRVAKEAPDELPKVGRAYLGNVLEKATEEGDFGIKRAPGMFRDWQNLGAETKKLMFKSPKLIEDLDNFFLGIKKLAENPNPSGSALAGVAAAQPGMLLVDPVGGAGYILGMGALAKMLYAPGFAKSLTQAMETPAAQTARSTGLFRHIVRSIPTQVLTPAPRDAFSPGLVLSPAGTR